MASRWAVRATTGLYACFAQTGGEAGGEVAEPSPRTQNIVEYDMWQNDFANSLE